MAGVLTTASDVICGHNPGKVSTSGAAKLTVSTNEVLIKNGIDGKSISGCFTEDTDNTKKCRGGTTVLSGDATKLTVRGSPAMLDTLTGTTDGMLAGLTPLPSLSGSAGQTKLTAI